MKRIHKALLIGTLALGTPTSVSAVSEDMITSYRPLPTTIKPLVAVKKPVAIKPRPKLPTRIVVTTSRVLSAPSSVAAARRYALGRLGSVQFSCLNKLWIKESNWNPFEQYGRAYGIPQAVPGYKMASAGSDWRTNPLTQVKWGLGYIRARYGTACAAWRHSQRYNWY